jgi:hypothetical protein
MGLDVPTFGWPRASFIDGPTLINLSMHTGLVARMCPRAAILPAGPPLFGGTPRDSGRRVRIAMPPEADTDMANLLVANTTATEARRVA